MSNIWVVDSTDDGVYQYSGAATRTSGSQSADVVFGLAPGNTNPQGIADPPPTLLPLSRTTPVLEAESIDVSLAADEWLPFRQDDNRMASVQSEVRERTSAHSTVHPRVRIPAETLTQIGDAEGLTQSRLVPRAVDRALADLEKDNVTDDERFKDLVPVLTVLK